MFGTFAVLTFSAAASAASAAGPLQISTVVAVESRVAAADGTTRVRLVEPMRVVPGDRVVVTVGYRNIGAQPLADVVLASPVPAGLTFRGPATGSPAPEISVDGRTFGALSALQPRGQASRPASLPDVVAVRWRVGTPIAPGAKGEFAFRAIVK